MTNANASAASLADIDLTDLSVFADHFPHEWFDRLRAEAPVWLHPATEGSEGEPFWVVSSHEHITEVHRSGTLYSHQTGPGRDGAGGIALNDMEPEQGPGMMMVMTDPPQHTSYRKLVNTGFTPRMIRRLEHTMVLRTAIILDRVSPLGECDFVTEIASELPLMAIADIIGVPDDDRDKLFDWSNRTIGGQDPEYAAKNLDGNPEDAMIEMAMYAHALTEDKRSHPGNDLWSRLVDAEITLEDGTVHALDDIERDLFFMLLVVAGNETTRNAITLGTMAFLDHPDQWQLLRDDPSILDTAVDEILRFTSPVSYFRRTVTADTELGGCRLAAGDKVTLWYPSGNRDEAVFDDPHSFDLTRDASLHMAFGAGGAHFCLGANLAKLELRVMFEELAKRLPDIEATGPAEGLRMNLVHGIKHLPVRFTPTPPVLIDG